MSDFAWTPDAVGRLKLLADGTRSASEIATTLGCARNGVIGKLTRLRAAGKIDAQVRLLPSGGNRGRPNRKPRHSKEGVAKPRRERAAKPAGFVPARSTPKPPSFLRQPDLPAIPADHALTVPPMGFLKAVDRKRCLFFAGDPYGPAGPDMPVCGARRPEVGIGQASPKLPPYCTRHLLLRYRPARAAA